MASFGLRRAIGLAALLSNVNWAVSQTSAPSGVVGYVVDDDISFTSITCELPNYQVYTNDNGFLFCDATTSYFMATDCVGGSTILYVTQADIASATENTLTCNSACTSLTVIQEYPNLGSSFMIYDCQEYMSVPSGVSVLYEALPSGVPSITTSADDESTTSESESTSRGDSTRVINDPTETADNGDNNNNNDDDDDGPNIPVIVGATVGSVAGVALIIAAIFIGIRIGRKKNAAAAAGAAAPAQFSPAQYPGQPQQVQQVPPMTTSPPLDKYGGPHQSVIMAHPQQPYPQQGYMPQGPYAPQPQQPPQGYYPPQGYHPPEAYSPQPSQPSTSGPPQSELPTGQSAQGWASSEDHPHPYEMEAMLQPGQKSPRPQ